MFQFRRLDLQKKVVLVLVMVIVPTFLVVTILENSLTQPLLESELRDIGVTTGEALAGQILSNKGLRLKDPAAAPYIEREILERLYYQPSILRMDVYVPDATTNAPKVLASSMDDGYVPPFSFSSAISADLRADEDGMSYWQILVPIKQDTSTSKASKASHEKVHGMVHLYVSTRSVHRVQATLWRITGAGAVVSVVVLIYVLNFFLRKTLRNEKLLRRAEDQNTQLIRQLHEAQQRLGNIEKLAVMGQLTANFAHEIGTPLNAMGGHLQLLKNEIEMLLQLRATGQTPAREVERVNIIYGELQRIEQIVKGFLQTTAKPVYQTQLVDVNGVIKKTIQFLGPRLDGIGVELHLDLDTSLPPLRLVPTDVEQILLNVINNSLDSMRDRQDQEKDSVLHLQVNTRCRKEQGKDVFEVTIRDTGLGIHRQDLKEVWKPFFTTKKPGEGTGLGLTISQQLAKKYGGSLILDSKEGRWTEVKLSLPYGTENV